ncbi:MAG TPA: hypothetical protein VK627_07640 [Edaphobacter sp.]|jgi:hypothetical protein|nr:hypothetical protein [Edaphobacter sp.]
MSDASEKVLPEGQVRRFARPPVEGASVPARSAVVNRTHRVIRERAKTLALRRSHIRSLWIPLAVCSALVVILCSAVWIALDQYEVTPDGLPDAGNQFLVLLLWFFPVSMALLAAVLFGRARVERGMR